MKDWIVILLVSTVASFVHCLIGFGDALLSLPFLLIFYPLRTADTIANNYALLIGIVLTGYSIKILRQHKLELTLLFLAYTLFTAAGMFILESINANALILMMSIVLIIYPFLIFYINRRNNFRLGKFFSIIFGAAAGFLGATTTVNGPPLVMYAQLRRFDKDIFIAIIQPIFLWGAIINFYGYYRLGLFNAHLTLIMLSSTPIILANAYICRKIRNKINNRCFSWLINGSIFLAGLTMFIKHIV